jgi:WD40 repeat protein
VVRYHILEGYYPPFTMSRPTAVNLRGDKLAITGSEQLSVNGDPVAGGGDTVMLANGTRLIWTSKVLLPPTAQTRPQDVPNSTTAVRHTAVVGSPAISPDGTHLVTGSNDTTSRLWELGSGQELRRIETPGAQVQSAAFSPDGQFVATSGSDGLARLWDARLEKELRRFTGHTDEVRSVVFSPDGKYILTASLDGTARLWPVK